MGKKVVGKVVGMDLYDFIVLLTSVDSANRNFGTGFVIRKDGIRSYVLTCAHVIRDVNGFREVRVEGVSGQTIAFDGDECTDLAVVAVSGLEDKPILPLGTCGEKGDAFVAAGFRKYGKSLMARKLDGTLQESVELVSLDRPDRRAKAWSLQMGKGSAIQHGYSGAPIVRVSGGYALGVVSKRDDEQGQQGLAMSVAQIRYIWRDMPPDLLIDSSDAKEQNLALAKNVASAIANTADWDSTIAVLQGVKELQFEAPNRWVPISRIVDTLVGRIPLGNQELQETIRKLCVQGDLQWHSLERVSLTQQGKERLRRHSDE